MTDLTDPTDPLDALHTPVTPVDPDPAFAARLRDRLRRAILTPGAEGAEGADMSTSTERQTKSRAELAWGPALTPYIMVPDARRALDWYVEVLDAERRGEPYVMPDGSIGHAELDIGDAVLQLAEDREMEIPTGLPFLLHVTVPDVDSTLQRALDAGASLDRPISDEPYGRVAKIVDPFGYTWMLNTPPRWATKSRPGDIGFLRYRVPDEQRAKEFFAAVLGSRFVEGGTSPMSGIFGGTEQPEVVPVLRVADLDAGLERVRRAGGQAGTPWETPWGKVVDCVDDQGLKFELWETQV